MQTIFFTENSEGFTELVQHCYSWDSNCVRSGDLIEFDTTVFGNFVSRVTTGEVFNRFPKRAIAKLIRQGERLSDHDDASEELIRKHIHVFGDDEYYVQLKTVAKISITIECEAEKAVEISKFMTSKRWGDGAKLTDGAFQGVVSMHDNGSFNIDVTGYLAYGKNVVLESRSITELHEREFKRTDVERVAYSDDGLDEALLSDVNGLIDKIISGEPKDYHPGSNNVVLDVVHPSLNCYVHGETKVIKELAEKYENTSLYSGYDFWGRSYEGSKYQLLPSQFKVDDDGITNIESYINNLDHIKYPEAHGVIGRLFKQTLPHFELICNSLRNDFVNDKWNREKDLVRDHVIPLRNRSLQVITKVVEYRVNDEVDFDGVWHVEGMSHENILATAVCVVSRSDNFSGAEISFMRPYYEPEGDELIECTPQNAQLFLMEAGGGPVRPLGTLATPKGRIVAFPNSHIHRLSHMGSTDGKDATRRIVVFWLINPDRPIISTADVEPQQGNRKKAKAHRLKLMEERKREKSGFNNREISLCEH
jgi:hypothetical protein